MNNHNYQSHTYLVTLMDERVNVKVQYAIKDCPGGDVAIDRARRKAVCDAGLPMDARFMVFSVVSVREVTGKGG